MKATAEVFGTTGRMEALNFQGKTDPVILRESLGEHVDENELSGEKMERLKRRYYAYLHKNLENTPPLVLPGVKGLLSALAVHTCSVTGLLTGNFSGGALIKLEHAGLNGFFRFGAFGDDAPTRNDLPRVAQAILAGEHGLEVSCKDMIIIGDTVHDITCAKHAGAVSVAVATGWTPREDLLSQGPDYFFDDLSENGNVLQQLL